MYQHDKLPAYHLATNSLGFRDETRRTISTKKEQGIKRRVLLMGDSFKNWNYATA